MASLIEIKALRIHNMASFLILYIIWTYTAYANNTTNIMVFKRKERICIYATEAVTGAIIRQDKV